MTAEHKRRRRQPLRFLNEMLAALAVVVLVMLVGPSEASPLDSAMDRVFTVRSADAEDRFLGSAFLWGPGEVAVTNAHVLAGRRPGDRVGHNWRVPNVHGKRAVRHALYDTNYWKSFIHARLAVAMGDKGCLSLFGDKPDQHRLFAEHLTAEYRVKTEGRGRTVDEWKVRPERGDNHWFDCLVGCAVAASIQGAVLFGTDGQAPAKRERVSFAELQRRARR